MDKDEQSDTTWYYLEQMIKRNAKALFKKAQRKSILIVGLVAVFFIFGIWGSSSSVTTKIEKSPEIGFTSFSPKGLFGGEIIPASCESGLYPHWPGDTSCPPTPTSCVANAGNTCTLSNACGQTSASGTIQCDGLCGNKLDTRKLTPSGHYIGTYDNFRGGGHNGVSTEQAMNSICSLAGKTRVAGNTYACAPDFNTQGCISYDKSGGCAWYGVTSYYAESSHGGWGYFTGGQGWCQNTGVEWVECGPAISAPPDSSCPSSSYPDLTAGATTVTPSSSIVGQTVTYSAIVSNIGGVTASNFPNIFQISITGSTLTALNAGTVSSLAPNVSTGVSATGHSSSVGTYAVRACANYNTLFKGSIFESNDTNNCGAWTTVTVTATPTCVANQGTACASSANSCGTTNAGTITCNGSCSAAAPANPSGYGTSCSSTANSCGTTNAGTITCNGSCSATTPANPANYGTSCSSTANSCGTTNAGTITCNGSCSATTPANPANYGTACTSAANACGQTNTGTYTCSGTCSAAAPSNSICPPSIPTLSALYQGGTYIGTTGSAYYPSGYGVYANATSPSGANLYYVFEWSPTEPTQSSGWVGSGGWGSVTHYVDASPGTYYVSAWAVDQYNNWSASPSPWLPITLTTTAPTVSCSGSPGNPFVGQPVTWSSSVTGGSLSYSYSWSGTDGLSGTTATVQKSYPTIGQKSASLIVTDTRSGQTGSASCVTGGNQSNGPTNGGSCSSGVCPGTCTASLSANPDTVGQGQNTFFTWSVSGGSLCASSCTGSGFNTNNQTSGNNVPASVPPVPPTTSYALTCSGGTYGPPPPANTTVTVLVPTVTFTVNGQTGTTRVNPNTSPNTTIVWSSENASSCTGTNFSTSGAISGSITRTTTTQTVYKIVCANNYGTHATASVMVNVLTDFNEF